MKKQLRVDEIIVEPDLQVRVVEPDHSEYEEDFRKKKGFGSYPPVEVIEVKDRGLLLVSGFTRLRAARAANLKTVPAVVTKGTMKDAYVAACGSNSDHGYRRTKGDVRRAVKIALSNIEKETPTNIARICNVSRTTVYSVKEELERGTHINGSPAEPAKAQGIDPGKKESPSKAKKANPEPKSEREDFCPVCDGPGVWIAKDDGYECQECKHILGEDAGGSGDEPQHQSSGDAHQEAVRANLDKARSAYGKLQRSLEAVGLLEGSVDKAMLRVHAAIEKAILAAAGK